MFIKCIYSVNRLHVFKYLPFKDVCLGWPVFYEPGTAMTADSRCMYVVAGGCVFKSVYLFHGCHQICSVFCILFFGIIMNTQYSAVLVGNELKSLPAGVD